MYTSISPRISVVIAITLNSTTSPRKFKFSLFPAQFAKNNITKYKGMVVKLHKACRHVKLQPTLNVSLMLVISCSSTFFLAQSVAQSCKTNLFLLRAKMQHNEVNKSANASAAHTKYRAAVAVSCYTYHTGQPLCFCKHSIRETCSSKITSAIIATPMFSVVQLVHVSSVIAYVFAVTNRTFFRSHTSSSGFPRCLFPTNAGHMSTLLIREIISSSVNDGGTFLRSIISCSQNTNVL